ncbi:MAG TPA: DUF1508 domain-containing protein [Gemmatales bacterium]|nr:DUF1508 domain-containing protein [Gemmatales bacterium]HMP18583.1 DUF1508 domain-containing protein [Gemmatales bacterium]
MAIRTFVSLWSILLLATMVHAAEEYLFELFKDAQGQYRWRLKNPEKRVIASPGQGYASRKYCEESVDKFKANLDSDKVKIEFYEDGGKMFRWRMVASNGQTVASSMFGYPKKEDCESAFDEIRKHAKNAKVVEKPEKK